MPYRGSCFLYAEGSQAREKPLKAEIGNGDSFAVFEQ
jgi:hypothetical protein